MDSTLDPTLDPTPPSVPAALTIHIGGLRALARRLLADEHLAEDAVQDACVAALERPPRSHEAFGAWLRTATRFFASKERRSRNRRANRELHAARPERLAATHELVEREALLRGVVEAVLGLPEPYRATVLMRYFDELPAQRIAELQGIAVATVHTRLRRAHERLRAELERAPDAGPNPGAGPHAVGARGLAAACLPGPGTRELLIEILKMSAKVKVALTVASVVAGVLLWVGIERSFAGRERVRGFDSAAPVAEVRGRTESAAASAVGATLDSNATGRAAVIPEPAPRAGDSSSETAEEHAHAADAPEPFRVHGRVVDAAGNPVPGAVVWNGDLGFDPEPVATADAEGRFALETRAHWACIGARARGLGPAAVLHVRTSPGGAREVTLTLAEASASLAGQVRTATGELAQDADVRLDDGSSVHGRVALSGGGWGEPPAAVLRPTDALGCFRAEGLRPGRVGVMARAAGHGVWRGEVELTPGEAGWLDVTLPLGAVVQGRVTGDRGEPLAGMYVRALAESYDPSGPPANNRFGVVRAVTDELGAYRLDGLDPGTLVVRAFGHGRAHVETTLTAAAGDELEWNPVLAAGLELTGRVTRGGDALAGAIVIARWQESSQFWTSHAETASDGTYRIGGLPDAWLEVEAWPDRVACSSEPSAATVPGVRAAEGPLDLELSDSETEPAFLVGRLFGPSGKPGGGTLYVGRVTSNGLVQGMLQAFDAGAGPEFRVGPLAPDRYALQWLSEMPSPVEIWRGELAPGETRDIGERRASETGRVSLTAPSADPLQRFEVFFLEMQGTPRSGWTTDFEGPGPHELSLQPGSYAVAGGPSGHARFEVHAGRVTHVEVDPEVVHGTQAE